MKDILLFTYGMLTNPCYMEEAEFHSIGELQNHKLEFVTHANIIESTGNKVSGTIWKIDQDTLDHMDMIEGYPNYYTRTLEDITSDNTTYKAYVYKMNNISRTNTYNRLPDKQYLSIMLEGYKHFGLPIEQIDKAMENICYSVNFC